MAYTQTDVDNAKSAITTIISRGAAKVTINGRSVEFLSLQSLQNMIEIMEGEVNRQSNGISDPVAFVEVSDD